MPAGNSPAGALRAEREARARLPAGRERADFRARGRTCRENAGRFRVRRRCGRPASLRCHPSAGGQRGCGCRRPRAAGDGEGHGAGPRGPARAGREAPTGEEEEKEKILEKQGARSQRETGGRSRGCAATPEGPGGLLPELEGAAGGERARPAAGGDEGAAWGLAAAREAEGRETVGGPWGASKQQGPSSADVQAPHVIPRVLASQPPNTEGLRCHPRFTDRTGAQRLPYPGPSQRAGPGAWHSPCPEGGLARPFWPQWQRLAGAGPGASLTFSPPLCCLPRVRTHVFSVCVRCPH